jgi:hypothetical protein
MKVLMTPLIKHYSAKTPNTHFKSTLVKKINMTSPIINLCDKLLEKSGKIIQEEAQKPDFVTENFSKIITWETSSLTLIEKTFGKDSSAYTQFNSIKNSTKIFPRNDHQTNMNLRNRIVLEQAVLRSVKDDIKNGLLYKIEHLVSADFYNSILEEAQALFNKNHLVPAGVLCRIIIEKTLKEISEKNELKIEKKDKASDINTKLRLHGIYDLPTERIIQANLDIGNFAAHGEVDKLNHENMGQLIKFTSEDLPKLQ